MGNKVIIHACGGAGINIAHHLLDTKVVKDGNSMGKGHSEIEFRYIDTSKANVREKNINKSFWEVKGEGVGHESTDGSGTLRSFNSEIIKKSIANYCSKNKEYFNQHAVGVYHIVIFSASGGSGSVIGTYLLKYMNEQKVANLAIIVGDNTTGVYTENTLKTLASLDNIANKSRNVDGEPLAMTAFYFNNSSFGKNNRTGEDIPLSEQPNECNKFISRVVNNLDILLSGEHTNIDFQDVNNILEPRRLNKSLSGGLYGLQTTHGMTNVAIPDYSTLISIISITTPDVKDESIANVLHYKIGEINAELVETNKELSSILPIRIGVFANYFATEIQHLSDKHKEHQDNIKKMNQNTIATKLGDAGLDFGSDDDMIF